MNSVPVAKTLTPSLVWLILGLAIVSSVLFWDTPFLLPLKIFTVYLHEVCHALAALLTGGVPVALSVRLDESGLTQARGGFFPLIAAAGYVGTAAIGALLIAASRHPWLQRSAVTLLCGLLLYLTVTALYPWQWEFWAGAGLAFGWLAINFLWPRLALGLNLFIGSFLCVYSVHDFGDFLYAVQSTDAGILANSWGLPFLAWPIALVWIALNVLMMGQALRYVLRG